MTSTVSPTKTERILATVKREVALVIGALAAAISALQLLAIPLPTWVHTVVVVVTVVGAALGIRARVSPTR